MNIKTAKRIDSVNEYFFSRKLKEIEVLNNTGIKVVNLGIGSPDLAPDKSVINELISSAQKNGHHGYQNYKGISELRLAIANWYNKIYGVSVNPDKEVLPLMGSKEGVMHISMTYLNEDDEVLIPNPGYPTYTSATNLAGGKVVLYELEESSNWNINLNEIQSLITPKTKLMWVNYPNMPTGATGNIKTLEKLVELARLNNILICNDNPYSLTLNNNPFSMLEIDRAKEVVIELNSLSKSHSMAGWRLGMMIANEERINEILKFKSNMDSGMFLPIQHAAVAALELNDGWYKQTNRVYQHRKTKVFELLDLLNCTYSKNQVGMFVWAKIPDDAENSTVFSDQILQQSRVFITPGNIFGSQGTRYIRVSLCGNEEMIIKAIQRIKIATLV
ncbi:MAG: pyridoxal phosphate-dependent aminotransferase [Flavobacteriales bacterium]